MITLTSQIRIEYYIFITILFFFFQAEDGIRDVAVTGVQTCALPILMSKESAYLIANMMEDVIQRGTGQAAKGMVRPLAGKTGTTDDFTDAWVVIEEPNLKTGAWVGLDEIRTQSDRECGARAAPPV